MKKGPLLISLFMILPACVHNGFVPTSNISVPPRPANCYLDIVLDGAPERPHVVLGRVTTDSTMPGLLAVGESQEKALERMKQEACNAGGHLLYKIVTGSEGQWNKDGYSRSTEGSAIVAIYVDEEGRPLPAPRGPMVHSRKKKQPSPKSDQKPKIQKSEKTVNQAKPAAALAESKTRPKAQPIKTTVPQKTSPPQGSSEPETPSAASPDKPAAETASPLENDSDSPREVSKSNVPDSPELAPALNDSQKK